MEVGEIAAGEEKKTTSFGISNLADERIKLIDILSEDDFLVANPDNTFEDCFPEGFRLSGFGNSQNDETLIQQKEYNDRLNSDFVEPRRPSFLRRSLAWDSAFFNNAGVLDTDELSFVNKGFRTNQAQIPPVRHDVRKRRSDSESTISFSIDWFEMEPFYNRRPVPSSTHRTKSSQKSCDVANGRLESKSKRDGLENVQALKKVDKSFRNKIKSSQTLTRKSINIVQSTEEKMNKEITDRSVHGALIISSPKPQKSINISNRIKDSSLKSNVRLENKSASTFSGKCLVDEKIKSASRSTLRTIKSPKFSSTSSSFSFPLRDASPDQASSSILKRKTNSRKSKISSSFSISKSYSERTRGGITPVSLSTDSLSLLNNKPSSPSETNKTIKSPSDLQNQLIFSQEINPPILYGTPRDQKLEGARSSGSRSTKSLRPSGLRPPSPKIGFFDENTPPPISHGAGTTRRKVPPHKTAEFGSSMKNAEPLPDFPKSCKRTSACKKLKTPPQDLAMNMKRSKPMINMTNFSETTREPTGGDFKRPRNKIGPVNSSFLDEEKRLRELSKSAKSCKESPGRHDKEAIELSRFFEAIDLNKRNLKEERVTILSTVCNENKRQNYHGMRQSPKYYNLSSKHSSNPHHVSPPSGLSARTPLADKTSLVSNLSERFASDHVDSKEEKLVLLPKAFYS